MRLVLIRCPCCGDFCNNVEPIPKILKITKCRVCEKRILVLGSLISFVMERTVRVIEPQERKASIS